jgi:uncharacterized protein YybS (DUF2232 family)
MFRQLPLALAAGLGSALLYAAALGGSFSGILLAYLAMLPLFVVGLSFGGPALMISAGAAASGVAVFGGLYPGLIYAVTHAVPCVVLAGLALRSRTWNDGQTYWYPPGRLLMATSLWCVALILIGGGLLASFGQGFKGSVVALLQSMADAFQGQDQALVQPMALADMATILPGLIAWSWMIMATLNGLIGQVISRKLGRALRPSLRVADIEVGQRWIGIFAICVVIAFLVPGDVGFGAANIAIVMAYPLFFQGLSVVHGLLNHWGAGSFGIGLFYVLLIFLGWLAVAVVALGLAEPLVHLRTRFTGRKNT